LILAILMWLHVWTGHPASQSLCGCGDPSLFIWYLNWPAFALAHGHNPFYSTAMGFPHGVNLLANTSETGIGIVLAPVTWVFGAVTTVNVALTLAPALSAMSMFVLLRRWTTWQPAALTGGLFYGFAPFMIASLVDSWLMISFAVLPPLVIACVDEILFRRNWSQTKSGLVLGVLIAVQFFLGSELLLILAIGIGIAVLLMAGYFLATGELDVGSGISGAPYGLAVGAGTALVLLAYPVWFALAGPAHLSGLVWLITPSSFGLVNSLKDNVVPLAPSRAAQTVSHLIGGYQGPTLASEYFGVGILAVALGGLLAFRRDRRLWLATSTAAIALLLAAGTEPHRWSVWRLFGTLPLFENVWPLRIDFVVLICASIVISLVMDSAVMAEERQQFANAPPTRTSNSPGFRIVLGGAIGLVALLPPAIYVAQTIPITVTPIVTPEWFRVQAPRLSGHQIVLTFPFTQFVYESAMTWQVESGMHFSLIGQGGPGGALGRMGAEEPGGSVLASLSPCCERSSPMHFSDLQVEAVRSALQGWRTTAIVIPDQDNLPSYDRIRSTTSAVWLMTAATEAQPTYQDHAWVWLHVESDSGVRGA
jgi:hypothetical protein